MGLGCGAREMGEAVALTRDAHISKSRYGAPGFCCQVMTMGPSSRGHPIAGGRSG